jgi:hypothetical protein
MPFALPGIEVPRQDCFGVLERMKEPLGSRGGKGFAAPPSLAHDLRRTLGTWYSQQNQGKGVGGTYEPLGPLPGDEACLSDEERARAGVAGL